MFHDAAVVYSMCLKCFLSTHRHPAHPASMPIRHPIETKLCSHKLRKGPIHILRSTSQVRHPDTRYIRGILMHVASGLFSWSMAAGLLGFFKSPACTYNQSWISLCPIHIIECETTFLEIYIFKNSPEGKVCDKFPKKKGKNVLYRR